MKSVTCAYVILCLICVVKLVFACGCLRDVDMKLDFVMLSCIFQWCSKELMLYSGVRFMICYDLEWCEIARVIPPA